MRRRPGRAWSQQTTRPAAAAAMAAVSVARTAGPSTAPGQRGGPGASGGSRSSRRRRRGRRRAPAKTRAATRLPPPPTWPAGRALAGCRHQRCCRMMRTPSGMATSPVPPGWSCPVCAPRVSHVGRAGCSCREAGPGPMRLATVLSRSLVPAALPPHPILPKAAAPGCPPSLACLFPPPPPL